MNFFMFLITVVYGVNQCDGIADLPQPLAGTNTYQLRMPGAVPTMVSMTHFTRIIALVQTKQFNIQQDDDYICTAFKLNAEKEMYITQFRVEGTAERAHHMILSGCAGDLSDSPTASW